MIYRFIRENTVVFRVETMCRIFKISRSGYYKWLPRSISHRRKQDKNIKTEIKNIYQSSRGTYGSPRIHRQLGVQGIYCGKKRVERLMKESKIRAIQKRKFKVTTDSNHKFPVAENLLNRNFKPSGPNLSWVSDITYIRTKEGWLYLAVIMDLYSRKVVGWAMSNHINRELVIEALKMAARQRRPPKGLILHSDQGKQYASHDYQGWIKHYKMVCSMSRKGNCLDNSVVESFFHTLKTELIYHRRYETRNQARKDIFEYIEVFYNRVRLHSAIGYTNPENYEKQRKVA